MLRRDALEELYAYTEFAWEQYAATFRTLPPAMIVEPAPGSGWPALKDALIHVIECYDGWLNYTLKRGTFIYHGIKDQLGSWDAIESYRKPTHATLRRLLDELADEELYRTFSGDYGDGPETLSIADVVANLLVHERGHHGDFNTLLYQLGQPQPAVDYRQFAAVRNAKP